MPKTTGGTSNVDTRLGEEIEGGRASLTQWSVCKVLRADVVKRQ